MKNIQKIRLLLKRVADLLRAASRDDWASALEGFLDKNEADVAVAEILSMYGGMGSLNDIVLYKDGQLLVDENIEFDALRVELYQILHEDLDSANVPSGVRD